MQNKAYLIRTFLTLFKMHSMSCVDVDVVDGKIDGIGGSFIIECEPNSVRRLMRIALQLMNAAQYNII